MIKRLRVQIPTGAAEEFSSLVNFVCSYSLLFVIQSAPMLPQGHIQDPGCSVESADGGLHLNTHGHMPLSQQGWSGLIMTLSRNSEGTNQEMCSHAACQGPFGHRHLSLHSHYGLILALRVELV